MPKRQVAVSRIFDRNIKATAPIVVNVGGARSSKSYSIIQLLLLKFLSEDHKEILIARKTLPSLRLTAYKVFIDLLHDYGYYSRCTHNKTNLTIKYRNSTVYFLSIDDPEKIKSAEFNYVFLEEANEFLYTDFMTLWMRMSAPTTPAQPNRMYLALNPSEEFSWINVKLVNWDNVSVIKSTYKDNPFLSEIYTKTLEDLKEIDPELYKIYALGEYAQMTNIIYKNYVIDQLFPREFDGEWYGLSFGFNHPTALIHARSIDRNIYLEESIYQTHLTNQDLIALMREMNIPKKIPIYADSAKPAHVEEIYDAGFNIHPAEKKVADGIDSVKRYKLHVHKDSVGLIKEIREYKWQRDKAENILDSPVRFNDDCMDAMRYGIHSHYAALSSIIYKNYVIDRTFPDRFHDEYYGLDWGFTHPTVLIHIGVVDDEVYLRETIYQAALTNQDLMVLMREMNISQKIPIYADSAEPARIEEIYKAGFNIRPAEKKVADGIDAVRQCKLHIHKDSKNLIREIRSYKWKRDKDSNILDEPIKSRDDCMDAMRYGIYTHGRAPDPGRFKVVSSSRGW